MSDEELNIVTDDDFDILLTRIRMIPRTEPTDKKELVEKYLNAIGLNNFKLDTLENIKKQVKNIIDEVNTDLCALFKYGKTHSGAMNYDKLILFQKEKSHHKIVIFELVNNLAADGYWNQIKLYKDTSGKQYIFRMAVKRKELLSENEDEYLFRSFNENLKHMILYFLLKYFFPEHKYKIIPEIYYFGLFHDEITNEKTFITVMEIGNTTLGKYFESMPTNYPEMKRILFTIYRSLELLNDIGLNFKHGDLKYNNILMNYENKPMIIDFGKSKLQLDDLIFEDINDISAKYEDPYMNVAHDMMQLLCSLFLPKEPSLMMRDASSDENDYIINVYEIFNFVKNNSTFILEGDVMKKIIFNKYGRLFIPYINFYRSGLGGVNLNILSKMNPTISFVMRSSEFAKNLGIVDIEDDKIFSKYEKKYLKYKIKYFKLKNNILNNKT